MHQPGPELTPGKWCLHRCSGDYQHLKGFISTQGKQPPKRGTRQRPGPQAPAWWELRALLVLSADGEGRFLPFLPLLLHWGKGSAISGERRGARLVPHRTAGALWIREDHHTLPQPRLVWGPPQDPAAHLTANLKPGSSRGCGDAGSGPRHPRDTQSAWPRQTLFDSFFPLSFFGK